MRVLGEQVLARQVGQRFLIWDSASSDWRRAALTAVDFCPGSKPHPPPRQL